MENKIECEQCKKTFASEEALMSHTNAKHGKVIINEKRNATRKPILKYGLVALAIVLVVGIGIYYFSSSNDNKAQISGLAVASRASIGEKASDFTLPSSTGNKISLSDYKGKNVLLYFQEGVMCDPCWKQTLDIQKEYDKLQSMDIELLTITVDPLNAITKNAKRFGITLPILADEDLKVSSAYDVLKDSMHPEERPGHTFILIDKEGNIIWRKAYFLASGSTIMTMNMNGQPMTMDMGMDMGTPGSVMYVPVDKLLEDLKSADLESSESSSTSTSGMNMSDSNMSMVDHTMCLTPIHNHVDFKMYIGGNILNFSQNNYMDQSNEAHFHKTTKVEPDDVAGLPNGLLIHVHKENIIIGDFLKTLDLPFNLDTIQNLKVYVNGNLQRSGLEYVMKDKDRILVTDSTDDQQIKQQIDSVTDYAIKGKEKNPSLFGGC